MSFMKRSELKEVRDEPVHYPGISLGKAFLGKPAYPRE
jgi:hypothetical protein